MLREYHFLRALATLGEVTYPHFTDSGSPPLRRDDLPFVADVVAVPKPNSYGAGQLARGLWAAGPCLSSITCRPA
jgi:hypothetical protein